MKKEIKEEKREKERRKRQEGDRKKRRRRLREVTSRDGTKRKIWSRFFDPMTY